MHQTIIKRKRRKHCLHRLLAGGLARQSLMEAGQCQVSGHVRQDALEMSVLSLSKLWTCGDLIWPKWCDSG